MGVSDRLERLEKAAAERERERVESYTRHVFDGVHHAILRVADEAAFDRINSSFMEKMHAACRSDKVQACCGSFRTGVRFAELVDWFLPLMQAAIYEHVQDAELRTLAVDGVRQALADALAQVTGQVAQ